MDKIKVVISGIDGNMGSAVLNQIKDYEQIEVVAGIGRDCDVDFKVFNSPLECDLSADVVIDFSNAEMTDELLDYCVRDNVALVLCTTGLSYETLEKCAEASKKIAIFKSANMSLGINLVNSVLRKVSNFLYGNNFDIEIIEKHHNQKVDAPSGTALLLADNIKKSVDDETVYVYDRSKVRKKRDRNEIGIHALRGGTIIGEHSVIFAGDDEVIEIKHEAASRKVFAKGAINASVFVFDKPSGIYNMDDLINEIL